MTTIINKKLTGREVVRVSCKEYSKNAGTIASFILKCLILEDKEVVLTYLADTPKMKDLTFKAFKIMEIAKRMLSESVATVCGGQEKVPEKYIGKKLSLYAEFPFRTDTHLSTVEIIDGVSVKLKSSDDDKDTVRSVAIRLRLGVDDDKE